MSINVHVRQVSKNELKYLVNDAAYTKNINVRKEVEVA